MHGRREPAGPNGGGYFNRQHRNRLEKVLARSNTTLVRNADEYLDSFGVAAAFSGHRSGSGRLFVRSDVTQYELYHELKHFGDFNRLGFDAYRDMGRLAREESVFQYLTRQNWLTSEEMDHAYRGITRLRRELQ